MTSTLGKRKADEQMTEREHKAAKPVQYGQEKNLDWVDSVVDFGIPDFLSRAGVRKLMTQRKEGLMVGGVEAAVARKATFLEGVCSGQISAPHHSNAANEQHYEVPSEFFHMHLGPRMKYSSGYYPDNKWDIGLAAAEEAMLNLYKERAQLDQARNILELGCGWGSATLWMAETFPKAQVTGVSNSAGQRKWIMARAAERGLKNIQIITCDVNDFNPPDAGNYDRIISIEMFEHMRNWGELVGRASDWLAPGGLMFTHVFCHREFPYLFIDEGEENAWMAKRFFTGGIMPSYDLFGLVAARTTSMTLERMWAVDGKHYEQTCNDWLAGMDNNRAKILQLFTDCFEGDKKAAVVAFNRWRMFYIACAECFGYDGGREWFVSHTLLRKPE